ncbi:UNKNOWN [Stylonychia lemnae]|uniref:Transmembrane protein n=1 Tax=Stylonychia lemnae TaxID=5949 RepID=A0A078AS41_STYLE|nr:UNKNOWN [Stylonychia lemnae]|eukprot:CDW83703.1 UNKNOWN [Stylonychia lemnae]
MTEKKKASQHIDEEDPQAKTKQTAYERFLHENKKPWLFFNLFTTLGSIGLAVGTFLVLNTQVDDCKGLKTALWLVFAMHIVNTIETIINLFSLEKRLCNGYMICGFFIFEIIVLSYMQVVYFEAQQEDYCMTRTPLMYFWMMGQILVFYFVVVLTICFFFRKFCQDPNLKDDEDDDFVATKQ